MTEKLLSLNNSYTGKPITNNVINGFFTVNKEWIVKYWNKAAEQLLNVKETDIIGKNLWEKFPEAVQLDFYKVYNKAFHQDTPIHFEEFWPKTGNCFDVIAYHSNDLLSVSFKTIPLSDKKKIPVRQLRDLNELYKLATEITNDCLWEWDLKTKDIFWIDGGHKRIFGYDIQNALIPQSFWESRIHPEDKLRVLAGLKKILQEETIFQWEDEYRFQKANGEYAYVHDRGHIIFEQGSPARIVGATENITSRKLTELNLASERLTKQREITDAVLTAQESERTEIGKELHDNLNQILVAAMLYMKMAKNDDGDKKFYIEKSCSYITDVIEEIRKISKSLIPIGMQHIGLVESIKDLAGDLSKINPIKTEFFHAGFREEEINEKMKINIFRIVQEQLTNVLRHSKATKINIDLSKMHNRITLTISDNGEGCDILHGEKGVGITNIKSRADLFNGKVAIVSRPGEGFELKVEMIVNNDLEGSAAKV